MIYLSTGLWGGTCLQRASHWFAVWLLPFLHCIKHELESKGALKTGLDRYTDMNTCEHPDMHLCNRHICACKRMEWVCTYVRVRADRCAQTHSQFYGLSWSELESSELHSGLKPFNSSDPFLHRLRLMILLLLYFLLVSFPVVQQKSWRCFPLTYPCLCFSISHIFSGQIEYLRFSSSFPQLVYSNTLSDTLHKSSRTVALFFHL